MRRYRLSNLFILFCLAGSVALAQKSAEEVFKEAEALGAKENNKAALPLLLEARRLFQAQGKKAREADVLAEIGSTYYVLGDLDQALRSYEEMLNLARGLGDRKREALATRNIAD